MIKPCKICGIDCERKNESIVPAICYKCKYENKKAKARILMMAKYRMERDRKKLPGHCPVCGRILINPSWKYCDSRDCVKERGRQQARRYILKKKAREFGDSPVCIP